MHEAETNTREIIKKVQQKKKHEKRNKMQRKKEHRTKSEARGINNFATRTRARDGCAGNLCTRYARGKIGTTCCPAGEFVHTITRACPAAGVNLFTRICAGEKFGISDTLKEFLNTRARGKYPQFSQSLKRVRPAAGSASLTRCAARRRVLESWTIN